MRSFRKAVGVLLMLTLALVLSVSAQAAETEDFQLKGGLLTAYHGPGGQVTIPEGVTHIGEFVFSGRWDITWVVWPVAVALYAVLESVLRLTLWRQDEPTDR